MNFVPVTPLISFVAVVAASLSSSSLPTGAQFEPNPDVITQQAVGAVVEEGDEFGASVAYGSLENGRRALLIGSWRESLPTADGMSENRCGLAHYVPIGPSGPIWSAAHPFGPVDADLGTDCDLFAGFGGALALGDFDGNGYLDAVVGGDSVEVGGVAYAGAVMVHYGDATDPSASRQLLTQAGTASDGLEVGDAFGWSLAVGRFNADAYDDLVISSPQEDLDGWNLAGMVHVYYGGPSGLMDQAESSFSRRDQADFWGTCGWTLAVADFDGDQLDDLAIGCPGHNAESQLDSGSVHVLWGAAAGLTLLQSVRLQQDDLGPSQPEPYDRFGLGLLGADLNGDGFGDLVVAAPSEDDDTSSTNSTGLVHVLFGGASGLGANVELPALQFGEADLPFNTGAQEGDRFGEQLAAGDFNGDGTIDLVVGAFEDAAPDGGANSAGAAWVLPGGADGPTPSSAELLVQGDALGVAADGAARFAHGLAAGDLDGDGADDLLIGAPWDRLDDEQPSSHGLVHVLRGRIALFIDGFESGDVAAWSGQSP